MGEYYALIIFSIVGQCLMAAANELIMIFIGLEISSIASYILAGFLRDDKRNNESALKYFLLGSFATAFLQELAEPSIELMELSGKLRRRVLLATQGRQLTYDLDTYNAPFRLNAAATSSASRRATGGDGARVVELTNAYAFAQQSDLLLPAGLIAHRPSGKSRDAQLVGSYKTIGPNGGPSVIIVMSVEEQAGAEVIWTIGQGPRSRGGWRFVRGTLSGKSLDVFLSARQGGVQLTWSDANSGRVTKLGGGQGSNKVSTGGPFTRLDG